MSYWVSLNDGGGNALLVEEHTAGGISAVGGCNRAEINITSNYSAHFDFGLLQGKRGLETVTILERAVADLGVKIDKDYYKPTKGNVGYVLGILLQWAMIHPDGVWEVV